ncbi:agmatine deiminase family protein [Microbacterium sp. 1P10UB]|uniref:agmatine deiminase family protein n=2 Tax=unclassified Microbacterium TaxID=2609290 RepID=UPI0039A1C677
MSADSQSTVAGSQWHMPPEWAPQRRIWMAWPGGGYVLGDDERKAEETRRAWSAVANLVSEYQEVVMAVDPDAMNAARRHLSSAVAIVPEPLNDAWMRDIGPTFVTGDDGRLGAVAWTFNGWGGQDWAQWDKDEKIGVAVARRAGAEVVSSSIVNEGGAIQVDAHGTVLATLTVQLDPGRNPGATTDDIEQEFERTLGTSKTVWLPRGLWRDAQPFATRGHVDMMAAFAPDGTLLVHDQPDAGHPDHVIMRENRAILAEATDARDRPFDIVTLPAPTILRDDEGFADFNYINHLVINDAVIMPVFDDPMDERAAAILAEHYPGREIRTVEAHAIFAQGGGVHCITQQEPLIDATV